MRATLDEQLLLHDAAAILGLALLWPATLTEDDWAAIIGVAWSRESLLRELQPALAIAWPDRSDNTEPFEKFLRDAQKRIVARSTRITVSEGLSTGCALAEGPVSEGLRGARA